MLSTLATNYQLLVELPAAQKFCALIGLPRLVPYWPALLAFAGLFQLLRLSSNTLSSLVFGEKFDSLTARQKYDWGVRVVSQVHAIVVVLLAIPIFFKQELIDDKLFGFDSYAAWVYTLRPSLQYYGASFIMFEASTIFLNMNWWMDKLGMTGSRLQLYNACTLLFLYLTVRLIFGVYMSYHLFADLDANGSSMPIALRYFYRIANYSIILLSYYWFYLMIAAVRKRFSPSKTSKAVKTE
ncbi:hypothetical protein GGH94_001162 [Coemansia aciculifera]|uniref:TLC domain-containing protein n=1 Tax=Coemansia aciculifera TaxID=417176 RepID=A0A9W8M7Y5_9FUNG|nr:hypothetical protein GGH94_001162 [Coemansia aciculifera]KAJ2876117.1 hypothetical protein GGH93_001041 [Coemansia aciculifera]KAJ2884135.1 hypothetical protein H4R27_002296 [Coemansia aciculifera]